MTDERVPRSVDVRDAGALGEATPSPDAQEHAQLTALTELIAVKDHLELSSEALARGLGQLERDLGKLTARRRPIVPLWWALPVAAAVLLAWLLPLGPTSEPAPPRTPLLLEAQNAHLTARLTGLPLPREELEQAQKSYRLELLARLEKSR